MLCFLIACTDTVEQTSSEETVFVEQFSSDDGGFTYQEE